MLWEPGKVSNRKINTFESILTHRTFAKTRWKYANQNTHWYLITYRARIRLFIGIGNQFAQEWSQDDMASGNTIYNFLRHLSASSIHPTFLSNPSSLGKTRCIRARKRRENVKAMKNSLKFDETAAGRTRPRFRDLSEQPRHGEGLNCVDYVFASEQPRGRDVAQRPISLMLTGKRGKWEDRYRQAALDPTKKRVSKKDNWMDRTAAQVPL